MIAWTIAGFVVGALGLMAGGYAVWQNRTAPARLRYRLVRAQLAGWTDDPRIGITFEGKPIGQRLCVLAIGFINVGRQRINEADIERPVTARLAGDGRIFDVVRGEATLINDETIEINVCPLAPGERRLVAVYHTGERNIDLEVRGEIANLPRGLEHRREWFPSWRYAATRIAVLYLLTTVAFLVFVVASSEAPLWRLALAGAIGVVVGLGLRMIVASPPIKRVLRRRSPFAA